jgi:polyketide synthase PksM
MNTEEKRKQIIDEMLKRSQKPQLSGEKNTQTGKVTGQDASLPEPIAIVGLSGYFPQSMSVEEFWKKLDQDISMIEEIPSDRFDWKEIYDPEGKDPSGSRTRWGGFIPDIKGFDPAFFNILPSEADLMDPRLRLLLMSVYHTLEDAGHAPGSLKKSPTGVFIAVEEDEYVQHLLAQGVNIAEGYTNAGMIANRISYFFDFRGPSEFVNTMCSGAAVAMHRAVNALRSGEISTAVVGAANIIVRPDLFIMLSRTGQMSTTDTVHSFGKNANGFLRAEGVASILLKPLSRAEADGDSIYAVIKNTSVNYNGQGGMSIAAPNISAHVDVITSCYRQVKVDPCDIGYIEAQGMGNPVADIAEWEACNRALKALADEKKAELPSGSCRISTIKSRTGHMHSASALGALFKIIRSFQTDKIHPILNFGQINPSLDTENQPCRLVTEAERWPQEARPRLAGLHSYGSGGNNAHVLIEEYQAQEPSLAREMSVIPLSAKSGNQLRSLVELLLEELSSHPEYPLVSVAHTLQSGRDAMEFRVAFVADDLDSLLKQAGAWLQGSVTDGVFEGTASSGSRNPLPVQGDAQAIAKAWVEGAAVAWTSGKSMTVRRLHLPGFPFDCRPYWITEPDAEAKGIREIEAENRFKESPATSCVGSGNKIKEETNTITESETGESPLSADIRQQVLSKAERIVRETLGFFLKMAPEAINLSKEFSAFGFDSILVGNISSRLQQKYKIRIEPVVFFEHTTPQQLIAYLSEQFSETLIEPKVLAQLQSQSLKKQPEAKGNQTQADPVARVKNRNISGPQEPIAIVGLSARLPQAPALDVFWKNLLDGRDCIEEFPKDRWSVEEHYHPNPDEAVKAGKSYGKWGGFIQDLYNFDPLFFNISPLEAGFMNPKERLFLQCVWHTLEDAGYTPQSLSNEMVGVFAGVTRGGADPYSVSSFPVANRVSYAFNFQGPSIPVDTACSSSLVAIHEACRHIHSGECTVAIAGGVHAFLDPSHFAALSSMYMLSPDGRSKSFGDNANGMVPGEGVGAIMLKPLSKAEADGDHIYGIIRGSATNHGGKTNGFTVPNPRAHRDLIRAALERAGVSAREISYVEAHGTGTSLGDPVEIRGLSEAFRKDTADTQYCRIGSVKSNIGHLEASAGISGLTKILLQMKYGILVPSLHSAKLNPQIDFGKTPFVVQQQAEEWAPTDDQGKRLPRIACISSFGAGGSNAHAVIEEYIPQVQKTGEPVSEVIINEARPALVILSGKNRERLDEYAKKLLDFVSAETASGHPAELADLAYTLQIGREAMEERLGLIVSSLEELKHKLQEFLLGQTEEEGIWISPARRNKEALALFATDDDMSEIISAWIKKGKYSKIIDLWVKGVALDWNQLYPEVKPRRISLPVYPFAKEWYGLPETTGGNNKETIYGGTFIHPLVQSNTSDFSEQRYSSVFTGEEFFLKHHVVKGEKVLPGVAYLEMAHTAVRTAAGELTGGQNVIKLKNVVWARPVSVNENPRKVHIALIPEESGSITYEIYTQPETQHTGNEEPLLHSLGSAVIGSFGRPSSLDLSGLEGACNKVILTPDQCYDAFRAMGVDYGPAHQGLERVYVGENQVLARLRLPSLISDTAGQFTIHPSITDCALQATLAVMVDAEELLSVTTSVLENQKINNPDSGLKPSLPFSLDELEVFGDCTAAMWAWIRYSKGSKKGEKVQKLDVDICDNSGNIAIRLKGFSLRVLEGSAEASGPDKTSGDALIPPAGMILMPPVWNVVPLKTLRQNHQVPDLNIPVLIIGGTEAQQKTLCTVYPAAEILHIQPGLSVEAWAARLREYSPVKHILWIAPDCAPGQSLTDEAIIGGQNDGVIQLFRITKALLALEYGSKSLALTIITTHAQAVTRHEVLNPTHASVHGLVGSLAKEYPHWKVRLFDFEAYPAWPAEEMSLMPSDPYGNALVHRGEEWFRQELVYLKEMAESAPVYRDKGVYVVIGGAGGIGTVWTRYMIEHHQAQVVWIGRREMDAELEAKLKELAAFGPAPFYIAADSTSRTELEKACHEIRKRFGTVHGVVHSAIVLKDQSLARMEEEIFRAALSAKVDISVRIAQAFSGESLDFVLFFSSMQSIVKTPGQSNYSAGCTFKDAFAHRLSQESKGIVRIVNWGYWGSVGVVASKEYQERMASVGMGSIEPEDGMEALKKVLSGPMNQVVVMKTSKPVIPAGMNPEEWMKCYPETVPSRLRNINLTIPGEDPALKSLKSANSSTGEMLLFMTRLLYGQLQSMGVFDEKEFLPGKAKSRAGWTDLFDGWFGESFSVLTRAGYLQQNGKSYTVVNPLPVNMEEEWKLWDTSKERWSQEPSQKAQVVLVERMVKALPDILTGKVKATDIMFPNSSMELVEGIHKGNPLSDYFNRVVAGTVSAYVQECLRQDPGKRLRILEIGAGTGGTTTVVLPALKPYQAHIEEYLYTDLSRAFLMHAERVYAPENPFIRTAIFDAGKPLSIQNIQEGRYDLIIAANVLHATPDIRETVRNAKAALATNGLLLLNEMSMNNILSHLSFGLLEGWWFYEDHGLRIPGCPALYPETWKQVLTSEGFDTVLFPLEKSHDLGLQVVVAESNGIVRQKQAIKTPAKETAVPEKRTQPVKQPDAKPRPAAKGGDVSDDLLRNKAISHIRRLVADTLKMKTEQIDISVPLEKYGIDSILVVQLTNAMNQDFEDISSTLFFEYQTIEEVTEFLLSSQKHALIRLAGIEQEAAPASNTTAESTLTETVASGTIPPVITSRRSRRFLPAPELELKQEQSTVLRMQDVAIVGLAGRYPQANNLTEFWNNLKEGKNCITEIPKDRWDWRDYYDEERGKWGKSYTRWGGFIDDADKFDPMFFQISPREAEGMDPQERIFLETAYKCIEDAGYTPANLSANRKVGVFVGVMNGNYPSGVRYWSIANRVSYVLNFQGPSIAIDTACSSSLTAIHLALESLYSGTCDCAIAGGVNVIVKPFHYFCLTLMNMLSSDEKCKAFGDHADGFVDGEGVGAVILKPLSKAIEDKDHIYGVIKGSSVNHGGKTSGYSVPSPQGQAQLVSEALQRSGVNARTIGYIEAHGTGTILGDPIEIAGLTRAFARDSEEKQFCAIGSVKSNIGHGESAAGIAGLSKVLLQMKYGKLVPSLHSETLNPNIDFAGTPFVVNQQLRDWEAPTVNGIKYPRRAGISSFGAGGANAHLIVEQYIDPEKTGQHPDIVLSKTRPALVVLSARNRDRLEAYAHQLVTFIRREAPSQSLHLADLAYTLQTGRDAMEERLGILAGSLGELEEKLQAFLNGQHEDIFLGQVRKNKEVLAALTSDEDMAITVSAWISKGKYSKLMDLWVKGLSVDWNLLYEEAKPRRISLPAYPFAGERYWTTSVEAQGESTHLPAKSAASTDLLFSRPVWKKSSYIRESKESLMLTKGDLLILLHRAGASGWNRVADNASLKEATVNRITYVGKDGQLAEEFQQSCITLFHILKEHLDLYSKKDIRVILLSDLEDKSIIYQQGLAAFLKSVQKEKDRITLKVIAFGKPEEEDLKPEVVLEYELQQEHLQEVHVRYPAGSSDRHVESMEYLQPQENISAFRAAPEEVFWITGGAGKIALLVARHLIQSGLKHIFLIGRSPLTEARKREIEALGNPSSGISVEYHHGDVSDREAMNGLLEITRNNKWRLTGVIHSAGIVEDSLFDKKNAGQLRKVLLPKTTGAEVLDEVTRMEELRYFVVFSSLASIIPNFGQSDYAAANAFLDTFALFRQGLAEQGKRSGKTISINWPYWKEGGMEFDSRIQEQLTRQTGMVPLSTANGLLAFDTILSDKWPQAIVNEISKDFLKNLWILQMSGSDKVDNHPVTEEILQTEQAAQEAELLLKDSVLNVFSRVTKIPLGEIHMDSSLGELGLDSIMIMNLVKELQQHLGIRLYVNEIQALGNIRELLDYLENELAEQKVNTPESPEKMVPEESRVPASKSSVSLSASVKTSEEKTLITEPPVPGKKAQKSIVVLGTPRGGSTLFRVMLNKNSKIFSPPELYLLGYENMKERNERMLKQNQAFLKEGLIEAVCTLSNAPAEEVKTLLDQFEQEALPVRSVYQYLRGYLKPDQYLVDKTPAYGQRLEDLQMAESELDQPCYIYLYRHPLSVMSSLVKNRFHKMMQAEGEPWEVAEYVWSEWNRNINSFLEGIPVARQIHIPYEGLVTNPEGWMKYLCARLGIEYSTEMIYPYRNMERNMVGGLHDNSLMIGDPNFLRHNAIDPKLAFAWEPFKDRWSALNPSTLQLATQLGYSIDGDNFTNQNDSGQIQLLPAQESFIHANKKDTAWHIVSELTFETTSAEGLQEEAVRKNFRQLLNYYPSLRTSMEVNGKVTIQVKQTEELFRSENLIWIDGRDFNEKSFNVRKKELISKLQEDIDIASAKVFRMGVIQFSESDYYAVMVLHHLIADGFSLRQVINALFNTQDWVPAQVNQKAYQELLTMQLTPSFLDRLTRQWKATEARPVSILSGKREHAFNFCKDEAEYRFKVKRNSTFSSEVDVLHWERVAASLYQVVAMKTNDLQVTVAHRFHRRNLFEKFKMLDDIGYYAGDVPFSLSTEDCLRPEKAQKALREQRAALVFGGVHYEVLANKGLLAPVSEVTKIRLNFQPFSIVEQNSSIRIHEMNTSLYEPGDHERLYDLDCIVRNTGENELLFIIRYNKKHYSEKTIQSFVADWAESLTKIPLEA